MGQICSILEWGYRQVRRLGLSGKGPLELTFRQGGVTQNQSDGAECRKAHAK